MNRIEALCGIIRSHDADAMLLTGEINLRYVTGETIIEGFCLLLADGTALYVTDGRYIEVAEKLLQPQGFQVLLSSAAKSQREYRQELLQEHSVTNLLYEDDVMTMQQFKVMHDSCKDIRFFGIGNAISELRAQKSQEELDCIAHAQRIAEDALSKLLPDLQAGITERQAAAKLDYLMAMGGSEKPSFDTIMLFGENTSKPHGVPSDRALRKGDFITIDFGAVWHGYHSDMTRTFAYGFATDEMQAVYAAVLRAQDAALAQAKVGNPCCEMHKAAAQTLADAGYGEYFTHSLGHSVGLEIHEMPVAALRCTEPLKNGVVMTNEPGVYIAGKFGVRIEDMLVIDGDAPRNLTRYPKELTILK